jgi:hypothetical protein
MVRRKLDMFSVKQKRAIADAVQKILRDTAHPELPVGEIGFVLKVRGKESWSWAEIFNNGFVVNPGINPWNERRDESFVDTIGEELGRVDFHPADYKATGDE